MLRRLYQSLALLVALASPTAAALLATATLRQTSETTFQVLLGATADDNYGVANYFLPIVGATSFTHSTPRLTLEDETGDLVTIGFGEFRSPNHALNLQAAQSLSSNVQVVYGLGQQAGNLATAMTAGQSIPGSSTFAGYSAPLVIGSGTFADCFCSVQWNNSAGNAAVQLYGSDTGRSGTLTRVETGDLRLTRLTSIFQHEVITSAPTPGVGIELDFGIVHARSNPAALEVTLSMIDFNELVSVTSIVVVGANAEKFQLAGPLPTQIVPGQTAKFGVEWLAEQHPAGEYRAQILVTTTGGNLVLDVQATQVVVPEPAAIMLLAGVFALASLPSTRRFRS
jgi:hypothetical protein